MDHDVQEAPDDGAHDAAQDDRGSYLPTSRLTPDTLAPGDVAPGILDDRGAAVRAHADEGVVVVGDVHLVRAHVDAAGTVHERAAVDREAASQPEHVAGGVLVVQVVNDAPEVGVPSELQGAVGPDQDPRARGR